MYLEWVRTSKRDAQLSVCFSPSSLTTDQGLDLMERLTQKLNLHAADLTQLSYVQTNILYTPALSQIMICLAVYNLCIVYTIIGHM